MRVGADVAVPGSGARIPGRPERHVGGAASCAGLRRVDDLADRALHVGQAMDRNTDALRLFRK